MKKRKGRMKQGLELGNGQISRNKNKDMHTETNF